jgi:hypothetical protein
MPVIPHAEWARMQSCAPQHRASEPPLTPSDYLYLSEEASHKRAHHLLMGAEALLDELIRRDLPLHHVAELVLCHVLPVEVYVAYYHLYSAERLRAEGLGACSCGCCRWLPPATPPPTTAEKLMHYHAYHALRDAEAQLAQCIARGFSLDEARDRLHNGTLSQDAFEAYYHIWYTWLPPSARADDIPCDCGCCRWTPGGIIHRKDHPQ